MVRTETYSGLLLLFLIEEGNISDQDVAVMPVETLELDLHPSNGSPGLLSRNRKSNHYPIIVVVFLRRNTSGPNSASYLNN